MMRMFLHTSLAGLGGFLLAGCGEDDAQVERGQRLLAQYQCTSCHSIPGVPGAQARVGPPLQKFGLRSYISGEVPNRPDNLARWIQEPTALLPGTLMPAMGASDADARDMAAYLSALR